MYTYGDYYAENRKLIGLYFNKFICFLWFFTYVDGFYHVVYAVYTEKKI